MNPEAPDLKQLSAEALRDLLNNLTQAKGFILEQAPEFCQQLVARGLYLNAASAAMLLLLGLFLIALVCVCAWLVQREARKGILDANEGIIIPGVLIGIPALVGSIPAIICGLQFLREALAVYVAPKVFLVEEITRMLK